MIKGLAPIAALLLLTGQGGAREILLNPPIDCDLSSTCFVQQYMDRDEGPGAADFQCNLLSYNDHSGTDFALPSLAMMRQGVNVLPSAPGTVKATRDGMPDISSSAADAPDITGKECGNGVVVDHGGGWETQYCHLRQGSVLVKKGQRVTLATPLGLVGMSGQAEFPHVHLSLRHNGQNIDPFHPDPVVTCDQGDPRALWQDPLPYQPGGLINTGFASEIPTFDAIKDGLPPAPGLAADAPALVLWTHIFGSRAGDVVSLVIDGPQGPILSQDIALEKPQARLFRATGKRLKAATWPAGRYIGTARLMRGATEIERQTVEMTITP